MKNLCAKPTPNPEEYKDFWIFIEQNDGKLAKVSLEMAGIGRILANKAGEKLVGVLLADDDGYEIAKEMIEYGVDKVIFVKGKVYRHYRTIPYRNAIMELVKEKKPKYFIFGATHNGRDLAPRIAVSAITGLTADCTELDIDPQTKLLIARRPAFGGTILADILCKNNRPQMASARPGSFPPAKREPGRKGEIEIIEKDIPEDQVNTKVIKVEPKEEIDITTADVIVAGGMGLGKKEGFKLLEELAAELNGIVAASRPTVDIGWITRDRQVGQTGKTVRPKLYIAVGISGAVQHVAGMKYSEFVIAINKDPNAPIFKYADIALVGDLYDIVPRLIETIRKNKGLSLDQLKEKLTKGENLY